MQVINKPPLIDNSLHPGVGNHMAMEVLVQRDDRQMAGDAFVPMQNIVRRLSCPRGNHSSTQKPATPTLYFAVVSGFTV
jgi:hypothetical protein